MMMSVSIITSWNSTCPSALSVVALQHHGGTQFVPLAPSPHTQSPPGALVLLLKVTAMSQGDLFSLQAS